MRHNILILICTIFALLFLHLSSQLFLFFRMPLVSKATSTSIKVYPSESIQAVAAELYRQKLIANPTFFAWMYSLSSQHLHFGEYDIKYPITAHRLLKNMLQGVGLVKHRLTIVEGWTFNDIRLALSRDTNLSQTLFDQTGQAIMTSLKSPETNPEGLFYPNTYFFTWNNTDLSVLKTAYQKMQTILQKEWTNRAPNLPYQNAYQALIVASLIERETALNAEKPEIASVIINRLAQHMPLQIDPTVLYGLKQPYGATITKKDLQSKTPYNTYVINGLPPTPICMPSESSINAALHPATTDYLYYVADGKGGHTFSKTYRAHEKAVDAYRDQGSGIGKIME